MRFRFLIALLLITIALPAQAGEGEERLQRFLDGLKTLRAEFVQTQLDPNEQVVEEGEGVLYLSRPGRFRLEYSTPYEQLYVADGERMWMYEIDLDQVSVREQGNALGDTPALLLSTTAPLAENFSIDELGVHGGLSWLELHPRSKDTSFSYMRTAMEGEMLRAMEMVDGFNNTTRLYFVSMDENPPLGEEKFQFSPPPGVDVIGDTGINEAGE